MRGIVMGIAVIGAVALLPADGGAVTRRTIELLKCQDAIRKESEKQIRNEMRSYTMCFKAVETDGFKKLLPKLALPTVMKCLAQLRKINDSRQVGKSHEEKAKAKMMKACDPTGKSFSKEDVLEKMVDAEKGLAGKLLAKQCVAEGGVPQLDETGDLVECIVKTNKASTKAQLKKQYALATQHLDVVKDEIEALSEQAAPPDARTDAVAVVEETIAAIDPDGDGQVDPVVPFDARARIVFVTSTTMDGDFGGPHAANLECKDLAAAAGLPGDFNAWLSASFVNAATEVASLTDTGSIPYVTVSGRLVAGDTAALSSGSLVSPIDVDENGTPVPDAPVWTATRANGTTSANDCDDFTDDFDDKTGLVGRTSLGDGGWTDSGLATCDSQARLYCIEVDGSPELPAP